MAKQKSIWKKGRGKLGVLWPLIGAWKAQVNTEMGKCICTRDFKSILGGKYIELNARWQFSKSMYEELALFGVVDDQVHFWSFTSDGKRSQGILSDASEIHPESICFEAKMSAGTARMVYWPHEDEGFNWVVESKNKKGWNRFLLHHYKAVL